MRSRVYEMVEHPFVSSFDSNSSKFAAECPWAGDIDQ